MLLLLTVFKRFPEILVNILQVRMSISLKLLKKNYPINVADLVFYIFVLCKYCVFDGNIIEIGNSRPEVFVAFE